MTIQSLLTIAGVAGSMLCFLLCRRYYLELYLWGLPRHSGAEKSILLSKVIRGEKSSLSN